MSLVKNLLKYFLILIVIIFCVAGLLTGIMFLFPNVNLFGFRFAANKDANGILLMNPEITEIQVETNNYDIVIVPNSERDIATNVRFRIVIENNFTGFTNAKYNDKTINNTMFENIETGEYIPVSEFKANNLSSFVKQTGESTKYVVKLKEPTGLMSFGSSRVVIYMPENAENVVYNLKTNTGDITFEKSSINPAQALNTSDITIDVKSYKGSFNLDNAKMAENSNLNIANYLGRVSINSEKIGNVLITSNSGNFTFKNIGYEGFAGNLTVSGNNPYVRVNTIYGNVNFDATTGFLEAKQIKGDSIINTENGIIRIDKALGGIETNNNSGETTIKQIGELNSPSKSVNIVSKSGAINLGGTAEGQGVYYLEKISAESSKVVVNNMYSSFSEIETTKGSVTVNFATSEGTKNLKVTTNSGAITLKNIYGAIDAKTGNSSKIYAEFSKLALGEASSFATDEGTIELVMPAPTDSADKQYVLNALNRQNKLNVQVGNFTKTSFDGEKDAQGYYNFNKIFPENVATTNTINVKTNSGKIIVKEK